MNRHWLDRLLLGFCIPILLCGCLGNGPLKPKNLPAQVQVTGSTYHLYLPAIMQALPAGLPLASNSMYITSLDANTLYTQGCALGSRDLSLAGKQDSVVILHFGYPRMVNGAMGASLYYPAAPATIDQIAAAVENFGYGYWWCVGADFDSHLRIGVGTSNYDGSTYSVVTAAHGVAWAQLVNRVNEWFANTCDRSCDGQVDAVGANDLELSWASYETSIDWLTGYGSVNRFPLYNFGALPGCPYLKNPNAQCGGGGYYWSLEQVWTVTYGFNPVFPLPEIYRTDGLNAQQWYLMSVYSYTHHGAKMEFIGPMSQYQACLQRGGCSNFGIDNTPAQAWIQLYDQLNADPRTSGESLPYVTDILWLNEPFPSTAALQLKEQSPAPGQGQPGFSLVDSLQRDLQNPQLSAADRARLEEKLRLATSLAARQVRSLALATPAPKSNAQRSVLPQAQPPGAALSTEEEIIEGSEGEVHTWEAAVQNLWQGTRGGIYYQVLAGASVDDPQQGLVLVIETNPAANTRSQQYYLTPEKTGALKVQQVQGTKIMLASANGNWVFDLSARAFEK